MNSLPASVRAHALRILIFLLCLVWGSVFAEWKGDAERVRELSAMLPPKAVGLGRPITDRAAWRRLSTNSAFATIPAQARKLADRPVPELTDELFLDYSRTGNRDRAQKVMFERREMLTTFVLAECLEDRGRWIKPLTNLIAVLCAERTWVYPAHDGKLNNFHGRIVEMDLRATAVAWELATTTWLLGDRLPEETRSLIRDQVHRRVLDPYRAMVEGRRDEIRWMQATHNWNAVCLAGVTGAALALEDSPERRAWFIAAAEHYIRNFLKGFTADGYCSEGLGYWNYGFGHFVMLSETLRQATGGRVDLLADPAARAPALFARRAEILKGIYPTIADCSPGARPDPQTVDYLDRRLGLESQVSRGDLSDRPARLLFTMALYTFLPDDLPRLPPAPSIAESPLRTWFQDGGVLICRTPRAAQPGFAAALKGGHNAEHHNHNDVGSFSLVTGGSMVICDPGAEVYTARTFSSKRYDSKLLNSFGHAVPVIAGKLQRTGAEARAVVLRSEFSEEQDTLTLDLRSAYAVPELQKLERTFIFRRAPASLTVRDEVAYSTPQTFESALVTWGAWEKVAGEQLIIRNGKDAVRVTIETAGHPFDITSETLNEDARTPTQPVRIGLAIRPAVTNLTLTLTLSPTQAKPGS